MYECEFYVGGNLEPVEPDVDGTDKPHPPIRWTEFLPVIPREEEIVQLPNRVDYKVIEVTMYIAGPDNPSPHTPKFFIELAAF